jgi:hypothetical protein
MCPISHIREENVKGFYDVSNVGINMKGVFSSLLLIYIN